MTLNEFFAAHPKCALGFSGGVDSAYLLYAGVQAGADIRPYYIKTAFQPRFERDDALRLAGELGVEVMVLELDALADPRVAANPAERCYYCKQNLFRALKARAAADGYTVLLDGTNASDEAGDRPGMRALRELEVRSPLRECGLTKADIRRLSREALALGYRSSIFLRRPWLITGAHLTLAPGDPAAIREKMADLSRRRRAKQPLEYPSAGSTFKRPAGHFAGGLIEQCGLKGTTVGGAQVSEKHAGFVINTGQATCQDILTLIRLVRDRVFQQTGVRLEPEVRLLGCTLEEP